jgi:hypothetical protein
VKPGIRFAQRSYLLLRNFTGNAGKTSANPPALLPSTVVAGGRLIATLSNSEYGSVGPMTSCGGGAANCQVQGFTGSAAATGCIQSADIAMTMWLYDSGFDTIPDDVLEGKTYGMCHYDATTGAGIVLLPTPPVGPCPPDYEAPGNLCRKWVVSIPQSRPTIDSYVSLPSKAYLRSLSGCASEGALIDTYYDKVLQHEMQHVNINDTAPVVMDATVQTMSAAADMDPEQVKAQAFEWWCQTNFLPKLKALNDAYDAAHQHDTDMPFSDSCATCGLGSGGWGGSGTGGPIGGSGAEATYCACNDPAHGKPRSYDSAVSCAVECPSGLRCFASVCRTP